MHRIETEGSGISKSLLLSLLCVVDWTTSEEDASTEALSLLPQPGCWSSVSVDKSLRALSNPLRCVCIMNVVSVEHSRQVLLHCCTQSSQPTTRWQQGLVTGLCIKFVNNVLVSDVYSKCFSRLMCMVFWYYTAECTFWPFCFQLFHPTNLNCSFSFQDIDVSWNLNYNANPFITRVITNPPIFLSWQLTYLPCWISLELVYAQNGKL